MNIFLASRQLAFVEKLFTAAGLNLAQFVEAGDESALQAHLAALAPPAGAPVAADSSALTAEQTAHAATAAQLASAQARINELTTSLTGTQSALAGAGVAVTADTSKLSEAIKARISICASEELAKRGVGSFPEQTPAADPAAVVTPPAKPALKGFARAQAAFAAQSAKA